MKSCVSDIPGSILQSLDPRATYMNDCSVNIVHSDGAREKEASPRASIASSSKSSYCSSYGNYCTFAHPHVFFYQNRASAILFLKAIQRLGSCERFCIISCSQGEPGSILSLVGTRCKEHQHVHESKKGVPEDSTPMQAPTIAEGKARTWRAWTSFSGSGVIEREVKW